MPFLMETREELIARAEETACGCSEDGEDTYCHLCRRVTCHWGEHSDIQLLNFIGRCAAHHAFNLDNCPSCGTAAQIGR